MIIDTSALIAILRNEPEAKHCALAIERNEIRRVSAANFVETALVIDAPFQRPDSFESGANVLGLVQSRNDYGEFRIWCDRQSCPHICSVELGLNWATSVS